jgi:hypothetical protein
MEHGFLFLDIDFLFWNMKHIDAICDVWWGNVCMKYIIIVTIWIAKVFVLK